MKRSLNREIVEGFDALKKQRSGTLTLRTIVVEKEFRFQTTATEIKSVRKKLELSMATFAVYLNTNESTVANWEKGLTRPNAQALLLIRLMDRYPDTTERLFALRFANPRQ